MFDEIVFKIWYYISVFHYCGDWMMIRSWWNECLDLVLVPVPILEKMEAPCDVDQVWVQMVVIESVHFLLQNHDQALV